jgi:chitodextrinase
VGGDSSERSNALALDDAGNAVVTGETWSTNFPTTAGAYDTSYNGSGDIFLLALEANGDSLLHSTFVGGSDIDTGYALALSSAGDVYVTGNTRSANFPTTLGAYDTSYNGGLGDIFVLALEANGEALGYSTFVGGSDAEYGFALALSGAGEAVITGYTWSTNFPTTAGAYDTSHNGHVDGFVLKLAADGGSLQHLSGEQ